MHVLHGDCTLVSQLGTCSAALAGAAALQDASSVAKAPPHVHADNVWLTSRRLRQRVDSEN